MAKRDKKSRNRGSAGNNRKAGIEFLKKNKQKEGVVETSSGLQYIVVKQSEEEGKTAFDGCSILIHQRVSLTTGIILEDTYKQNKPSEANFNELILGFQEGILLMQEGDRYKFFVPPELAWGKKGSSDKIPPESVLIFDVKLLKVS